MSDYLSPDELAELTDARARRLQERWLRDNGFTYAVSVKGNIKVLRAHRDAKMGLAVAANDTRAEPDFSVFARAG